MCFFYSWYGDHRDLHVLSHSCPTLRSSDLKPSDPGDLVVREDQSAVADSIRRYAVGQQLSGDIAVRMRTQPDEPVALSLAGVRGRSEEHTSELQSLMRISYAVFCLKKKKT